MSGRLIVVTGTGTAIGKTHVACALLTRGREDGPICGFKPIESGAQGPRGADGEALLAASHPTFHVKPPTAPYVFRDPVSPHLAARREGRPVDLAVVCETVNALRQAWPRVLVELAGGLFSPLTEVATNAELVTALESDAVLLVAPDRLGVLHDIGATVRAAQVAGIELHAIALVAPAEADASTGTNADECALFTRVPVHPIPRATVADLAGLASLEALYAALF